MILTLLRAFPLSPLETSPVFYDARCRPGPRCAPRSDGSQDARATDGAEGTSNVQDLH